MGGRNLWLRGSTAFGLACALAACGGGGQDPETSPGVTDGAEASSSEVTAEQTAEATTEPAEPTDEATAEPSTDPWAFGPPRVTWAMKNDDMEGAIAFVEYYVDVMNYSYATLDTTDLERYSHLNCVGCQATIDGIHYIEEQEITIEGGQVTLLEIKETTYFDLDALYSIDVTQQFGEAHAFDKAGVEIENSPGREANAGYIVMFNGAYDWTMVALGAEE